jgi:CheY-specific phosphatase CheX
MQYKFFQLYKVFFMSDLSKDISIGLLFLTGLVGFISGEFIISSCIFAAATIASNININHKRIKAGQLSWN